MTQEPVRGPCENCGATRWRPVSGDLQKHALTTVTLGVDPPAFDPALGIIVDVYQCEDCGLLRLISALSRP